MTKQSLSYSEVELLPKSNAIRIGDSRVQRASMIKLLGMYLDENLTLKRHIAMKSRAAACAMFNLKKFKPYLPRYSTVMPAAG
jgi:hypothetical protein